MSASGEQTFSGAAHRIRFLFQPSVRPAQTLVVCFADADQEPRLQYVDELRALDVPRLYVLDDFGPYAGEAGYPGCWYLGEGRRLTFADDVAALAAHAAGVAGLEPAAITAVGLGAGGFAALHLALRARWGRVIAGFPHTRLGRHFAGDLAEVAAFVAGGTGPADLGWLDELLFSALENSSQPPQLELLSGALNYGRHVLPLMRAAERQGIPLELTLTDSAQAPEQCFASHLIGRLADVADVSRQALELDGNPSQHVSPWSRRSDARLSYEPDGLRCFAPATDKTQTGMYAGVRFEAGPIGLGRLELTLRRPSELHGLLVDALDADDHRLARWQWRFDHEPAPSGPLTLLLGPADRFPIKIECDGDLADTARLDVFARLKPGGSADFTVRTAELLAPVQPPAPGLPLPAPVDAAAGIRRLRDHAVVARQVAALVEEGNFPPPAQLPEPRPRRPDLKVACLLDPFSELGFRYEFDYIDFTPDEFRDVIDAEQPQMLLVESIWRGKNGTWNKLMVPDTSGSGPTEPVIELVRHCKARGIPTVFWNKEDPPNFEHFVRTAALFDYVFTTDESCVPRYQTMLGHDRIGVLPFSAQPAIHNPIGAPVQRPLDVAFLGTFYGRKHAARKRQMEMILDPAREFGVHIYSRVEASGGYAFPDKYVPHLIGTVPYEHVLGAYRTYKVLLNVNSVPDSTTMCARRVFEILACGGAVVSGPSPAIEAALGPGVVHESATYRRTRDLLEHVLGNDSLRERTAVEGMRRIHRGHTYSDRVDLILRTVGLQSGASQLSVAMVATVADDEQAQAAVTVAIGQSRRPEELVLAAAEGALDVTRHTTAAGEAGVRLRVVPVDPRAPAGASLLPALDSTEAELVGVLSPRITYGTHYLEDLLIAQEQSAAEIVGKGAHYRSGPEGGLAIVRRQDQHRAVDAVHEASVLAHRSAFARVPISPDDDLEGWQRKCSERGLSIYASDRFNFVAGEAAEQGGAFVETFGAGAEHALA